MISRPLLNLMLALTLVLPVGAWAEEVKSESADKSADKSTDKPADTAQSIDPKPAEAAKAPLSGNVVHSVKDAQIAIKDLGDTSKHLKDAAWCTFCEVQQPDQVYVGGPNIVGATMVIPAINTTGARI